MQPVYHDLDIDHNLLTALVQKALDRPGVQIVDFKAQALHGGVEWNSVVFRIQGTAREMGEVIPWSLILKVIKSTPASENPSGIWYWKREALAYRSGLLHDLPGGNLSAPLCYAVNDQPDGTLRLWLEEIKDDAGSPWPVEQYARAARNLGQFNGAYLVGRELPSEPWITDNWLRQYVENAAPMIEFIRSEPHHPVVRHMFPGDSVAQILGFWDEHESMLGILDDLPQVFCHQDAFKRNLFTRRNKTIAIDWGYMGIAPLGAELAALVAASLAFFEIPVERVREMDRLCFEGYLQGLRDAGWHGDPRLVRRGYAISCLLRYPIGGSVGEMLPTFLDQEGRSRLETAFKERSADELERSDPAIVAYYQGLIPEAMKLLGIKTLAGTLGHITGHMLRLRMKGKN